MAIKHADPIATERKIKRFFEAYQHRMSQALEKRLERDIDAESELFTESFIEAHPGGVIAFENDDLFRDAVSKNYTLQRMSGLQSIRIADLTIAVIDENHTMVKVHWEANYRKKDRSDVVINLNETYVMQTDDAIPNIVVYTADDREKILKEHGIIAK